MIDRRQFMGTAVAAGALPAVAGADAAEDARLRTDWAWLGRYAEDNRRLIASGTPVDVVFMGDSITQGWRDKRPGFFVPGRVGRGIGGQTTPQMLLRMMGDVVALRPRMLHLMGGTNDIAGNTGPMTIEQTQQNLTAMCQIARANGIGVLLASIPPAASFPWRPDLETVGPIRAFNAWARERAGALGVTFVDYTLALGDGRGGMRKGYASDGVHPTEEGYQVMERVLTRALSQ